MTVPAKASDAELTVGIVLLPSFTLSAFSAFVDALRIAADEGDRSRPIHCRWTIVGLDRTPVRASCGVEVTPWQTVQDAQDFDYLIVVGGLVHAYRTLDRRLIEYLRRADSNGLTLVGICTGSFALARAGLMKGYRCCVHWYHREEFLSEFPDHMVQSDTIFVRDGKRITCPGGLSAIDVAVFMIGAHCGAGLCQKVISAMMVENARGPKHPQPHAETHWFGRISDLLVRRAILLMEQTLSRRVAVHEIAGHLGVSESSLERAFARSLGLPPAALSRALRIARGHWEVVHGHKAIAWIASDLGFADVSHFTRLHREYYGITPAQARKQDDGKLAYAPTAGKATKRAARLLREILHVSPFLFDALDWSTGPGRTPK